MNKSKFESIEYILLPEARGRVVLLVDQAMSDLAATLDGERMLFVLGRPSDEEGPVLLALQQLHCPVPVNVRHQPGLFLAVRHLPAGLDQQPGIEKQCEQPGTVGTARLTC